MLAILAVLVKAGMDSPQPFSCHVSIFIRRLTNAILNPSFSSPSSPARLAHVKFLRTSSCRSERYHSRMCAVLSPPPLVHASKQHLVRLPSHRLCPASPFPRVLQAGGFAGQSEQARGSGEHGTRGVLLLGQDRIWGRRGACSGYCLQTSRVAWPGRTRRGGR